jgi:hypothetical protein
MNDVILELQKRCELSRRALAEMTNALRDTMIENDLLRAELDLANLKLQQRAGRHLHLVETPNIFTHTSQAG